jgi:hypothetical protein
MKNFGTISTTALFLLLGLAVPAHARQEKQEESTKPPKQEQQAKPEKQQEAKPQQQQQKTQQQAKGQQEQQQKQQDKSAKQEQQQQVKSEKQQQQKTQQQAKGQQEQQQKQEAKSEKQQQQKTQQQAKGQQEQQQKQEAKSDKQQQHQLQTASSHGGPQRTERAMATQRAQPELRLSERGSGRIPDDRFRSHFGREHHFHMGNPVMVGGYSRFQYGGFWFGFVEPWPDGWYYTDDFYIDYVDGGYYMYNPYYPGARFAITVVM